MSSFNSIKRFEEITADITPLSRGEMYGKRGSDKSIVQLPLTYGSDKFEVKTRDPKTGKEWTIKLY
ncbi:hypothetical protein OAA64_01975 [bacterium]|nr:hypothetical protein [bacterium]